MVCREELSPQRREQLAAKLRHITGLPDLKFDDNGILRSVGSRTPLAGSEHARALLANAINGRNVVVVEDASNSSEVAFCRVIPGRWKQRATAMPPVFVIQIDFADFDQVVGDERALAAFNVGWDSCMNSITWLMKVLMRRRSANPVHAKRISIKCVANVTFRSEQTTFRLCYQSTTECFELASFGSRLSKP